MALLSLTCFIVVRRFHWCRVFQVVLLLARSHTVYRSVCQCQVCKQEFKERKREEESDSGDLSRRHRPSIARELNVPILAITQWKINWPSAQWLPTECQPTWAWPRSKGSRNRDMPPEWCPWIGVNPTAVVASHSVVIEIAPVSRHRARKAPVDKWELKIMIRCQLPLIVCRRWVCSVAMVLFQLVAEEGRVAGAIAHRTRQPYGEGRERVN